MALIDVAITYRYARDRLKMLWRGGDGSADSESDKQLIRILIDLSCYESDDLVRHSLKILTEMHFVEDTLFTHAAHSQLLTAAESIQTFKEVGDMLPKLRHLLSIDCDADGLREIVDYLQKLTGYCTCSGNEEPHKENQILLYNYGNSQ